MSWKSCVAVLVLAICCWSAAAAPALNFVSTAPVNDFVVAAKKGNVTVNVFPSLSAALGSAAAGDGLLIMADDMLPVDPSKPQTNTTTNVTADEWSTISKLGLRVYIEFPSQLPSSSTRSGNAALPVAQTLWERAAVSSSTGLGPDLAFLDLLHPHKHVDYVQLPAALLPTADIVLGVIAGYDNATYGMLKLRA